VGNTISRQAELNIKMVHPHVRGEYVEPLPATRDNFGSSPRAWGILRCRTGGLVQIWFIPTCVGNTPVGPHHQCINLVHPHVRGEYPYSRLFSFDLPGSSPRAWGILAPCNPAILRLWFIPTCVGNTIYQTLQATAQKVHPHVRGEYV